MNILKILIKRLCIIIKRTWMLLLVIAVSLIAIYILRRDLDRIFQTVPIIVLVFVTLYYAIETHRLVEEGRKKRVSDFWEKRILEFYMPTQELLLSILLESEQHKINKENLLSLINKGIHHDFIHKKYMISKYTIDKLKEVYALLLAVYKHTVHEHNDISSLKQLNKKTKELSDILIKEVEVIENKIRIYYEY